MAFNFNNFRLRIEGESGLLFEFIKLPLQEEHWVYYDHKKDIKVWQIWDRQGLNKTPQVLGLTVLFLFMTVYKMVDQVFEQILEDNGKTPSGRFWNYQEKIEKFKSIQGNSNLILPRLFQNYHQLLVSLFNFYDQNKEARNAIVHRRISLIHSSNFFVKFKDILNSQEYDISLHPSIISEKYFLIRALTEDFPEYSVIDFKRIIYEISRSKDQKIKIDELILKLGSVYEIEINWYIEKLIKNGFIEKINDIIQIKSK
jgi:hypothetical protein